MGRRLGRRLVPLEIVPVPAPLRLLSGDDPGLKVCLRRKELPHPGAGLLVFVHPFGDDVPRAGQRLVRRGHPLVRVDERGRGGRRVERRLLREDRLGKRLQPLLPCDGCPRPSFGAERKVDVLKDREGLRGGDLPGKLVGEQFPLRQGFDDCVAPSVQLVELCEAVADLGDLHLVEGSGGLFPVTGDERHRGPFGQKSRRGRHAALLDAQLAGDLPDMMFLNVRLRLFTR